MFLKAVMEVIEIIHHKADGRGADNLNPHFNIDYLFISHPLYTREIVSFLGDEELIYIFHYFGFPNTLVF